MCTTPKPMRNINKRRLNTWRAIAANIAFAAAVCGGDWQPGRVLMLKFPSRAAYDAFMDDPDYRPWREKREAMTTIKKWVVIDGV